MPTITRFEDLEVWKLAREQACTISSLILTEPLRFDSSIVNQISRSSGSVMDNLAEGFERSTSKEFIRYLTIAKGSNAEVRSQLYRCFDRKYISAEQLETNLNFSNILGRKLYSLIQYLKKANFKEKTK